MSSHHHASSDQSKLLLALLLTGSFMFVEVLGGLWSGSLALLADAGHMLTDTAALGVSYTAIRLAQRRADHKRTYGYQRATTLAAFANALALLAIIAWITFEAIERLWQPTPVLSGPMLAVASVGLLINLLVLQMLHQGHNHSLNVRAAALHVMGDLLGSIAAIAAALTIMLTGWTPIDPILSLLISMLVLVSAWELLRESSHILLEGAPAHINPHEIRETLLREIEELEDVHHIHGWSLSEAHPLLTLHARIHCEANHDDALRAINRLLREEYHIHHATIQIERNYCSDQEPGH